MRLQNDPLTHGLVLQQHLAKSMCLRGLLRLSPQYKLHSSNEPLKAFHLLSAAVGLRYSPEVMFYAASRIARNRDDVDNLLIS